MTAQVTFVLKPDDRVTCPKCEHEFSLEQGFARQALEGIEAASSQALEALREQERLAAEKRAQQREKSLADLQQRAVDEARRAEAARAAQAADTMRLQLEALQQQF